MGIDIRTGAIIAGAGFGAYTSDITENPLSGIITTGIGAGVGAFLNIPTTSLMDKSRVNVGPVVNMDYIREQQLRQELGEDLGLLKDKFNSFYNRTKTPLDSRLNALSSSFNSRDRLTPSDLVKRQIQAQMKLEDSYQKSISRINNKYDSILEKRLNFSNDLLEYKKGNLSVLEKNKEIEFYNRMTSREESSISRYLETPRGRKELKAYDQWIEKQKSLKSHLRGRDNIDLRNALFKEYTTKNNNVFKPILKRQEYYNKRLHADKKDLFNPWLKDFQLKNKEDISNFELRSSLLFDDFKVETNRQREEALARLSDNFNTRKENVSNWVNSSQDNIYSKRKDRISKYETKVNRATSRYQDEQQVYDNIKNVLKSNGINVGNTREEIFHTLNNTNDVGILTKVNTILKDNNTRYINQSQLKVNKWDSKLIVADNLSQVTNWLKNQLGNNAVDAEEKARLLFNRSSGEMVLKDGVASFVDKVSNERVSIPLTSYNKDGSRYHNMGNGNYSVASQFNPYSKAYVDGLEVNIDGTKRLVTAADIVKGYDPEMLLKYLPEDQAISSILPRIDSLFHYNSQETGVRTNDKNSQIIKNSQGLVDLNSVLRYNQYGEIDQKYPLRSLKQSSTKNMSSERQRAFLKLAQELPPEQAAHLFDGLSLGNLTSINTQGYNSLAVLAPNERGETSVGNRGTNVVNKNLNTQSLESMIGSERFNKQFSSSQVLNRLDIMDDKLFNSLATYLYGNDMVLGDGAGFFNMGDVDSLRISDKSTIKIPLSNNMAIANQDLLTGLTSSEDLSEYLQNNPISIDNYPLAYKENGSPIHLNKMYTEGKIIDGFMTEKDIRLVTESIFDPTTEQNMKFYSTGTKSLNTGLTESRFNVLTALGTAINQGKVTELANGSFDLDGINHSSRASLISALIKRLETKDNTIVNPVTLISRAEDTGASKIRTMLREGARGNSIYDLLMKRNNSVAGSAMVSALFSEHKGAVDLTSTLAVDIENKIKNGSLNSSFREDFLYHFNIDNFRNAQNKGDFLQRAYNIVASSDLVNNYLSGHSLAVGSFNKGASIVGKDKKAKLSWAAITNLKSSGFTSKDLSLFGLKNEEALYELRSISEERRLSKNSINSIIQGKEGRFLNILTQNNAPEQRLELLRSSFGRSADILENNPYLTYNLSFRSGDVQSINFSRLTTNRSGLYEDSDLKILKELEKRKIDIMVSDLAFRDSKTKEERIKTEQVLKEKLEKYDIFTKNMMSGDNNLLKTGLSLYSDKSSIMQVKYIGGNADKFATSELKENRHVWFVSEDDAQQKAKQLGVDLNWETVDGYDNLKRPVFKRGNDVIPLASLITREPAQGPLSSDLISLYVDTTLNKNNAGNVFIPISNDIYYNAMFGDGDQDMVQTLLGDFQTRSQYEDIERKRAPIRQSFFEMAEVTKAMKVKGKKSNMKSALDFQNAEEYATYRVSGGLKGRNRKTLAAPATGLAVSYAKALEMNLGHLGSTSKELTQGRAMIHQLVESLLKSAYLDTDSFQLVNEQAVERLTRMRNGFLGIKGYEGVTTKQYEEELRRTLPSFVGINNIDTSTLLGKQTKAESSKIVESIISAEINHARQVKDTPFTPLDLNEKRFGSSSGEFIDTLNSIIKEQGITEMDYESGLKHLKKSTGQVALGATDFITDVVKNNKMLIGGGLAAMAGVALLGREQPSFSDSRSAARQHSASMLRSPGAYDGETQNNTPMGVETNPNKAGYILPKTFGAKGIKVGGEMVNGMSDMYNEYNSMLDSGNVQDQIYNLSNSLFGDGIRSARLQTN